MADDFGFPIKEMGKSAKELEKQIVPTRDEILTLAKGTEQFGRQTAALVPVMQKSSAGMEGMFSGFLQSNGPALTKLFNGLMTGKGGGMKDLLDSLKENAIKTLARSGSGFLTRGLGDLFRLSLGSIIPGTVGNGGGLGGVFDNPSTVFGSPGGGGLIGSAGGSGGLLGGMSGIFGSLGSSLGGFFSGGGGGLSSIFSGLTGGGGGGRQKSSLGGTIRTIAGSAFGPLGGAVGGALGNVVGKIFKFAEGGLVTGPTLGLIGEGGPELIVPLRKLQATITASPEYKAMRKIAADLDASPQGQTIRRIAASLPRDEAARASASRAERAEKIRERRMRKVELREVVREVAREGGIGNQTTHNHNDFRGSFFPDHRSIDKLEDLLEDRRQGRRRFGRGGK